MKKISVNIDIAKILKKNIAIIIPAAIAFVAVLLFIPTAMMRGKISENLEQSQRLAQEVDSTLYSVVSEKQHELVKAYEDLHEQDSNDIHNLAVQTTQRELLSYKIFPEPNETSSQIFNEFKQSYTAAFATLIKDMNALDAPSDAEIKKEAGASGQNIELGERGRTTSSAADKSNTQIIDIVCKRRGEEVPVYANPQVFSGYGFWDGWEYFGMENAVRDCWYSQMAYWIHRDIVDSINSINKGSASVSQSSVKRLLGIRFESADAAAVGSTGTAGSVNATELPQYVIQGGGQLCSAWTKRTSGEKIDIVHFSVAVVIRANDVLKFMDALCSEKEHYFAGYDGQLERQKFKHNQITILQSNIDSVDRQNADHLRYRYGQDAVVHLNLICEYLFNREGYDAIKPKTVAAQLNPTAGPGQQQAQPSRQTPRSGKRGSQTPDGF
ncbi:MAG: hypothetical protein WC765_04895 [Phycisphaerae bacterium]|jgi:hypothetical protein